MIYSQLQNLAWDYFWPHFEKQDGCHRLFFHVADFKSAYISHIIDPRDFGPTKRKLWARTLLMGSDLTLGLSFKVIQG